MTISKLHDEISEDDDFFYVWKINVGSPIAAK